MKIQNSQQGFTFLESLLALFILSIGLLGVAGMHAQALKSGYMASQNMAVVLKGEQLIERIRANPKGLEFYDGGATNYGCASGSPCTAEKMAADDLHVWETEVKALLTSPSIDVHVNAIKEGDELDPDGQIREVVIKIDWASKSQNYSYSTVAEIGL